MSVKQESKQINISKLRLRFYFILVAFLFNKSYADTKVPRISVQTYHQGTVMKIYLSPGRSSVVDFPCQVTKASGGTAGDLHVTLATSIGNEVDLALDSSTSRSTSLIVRCKENIFVFDVIPSRVNHQNYIKIRQSRGSIKYYSETNEARDKINGDRTMKALDKSKPSHLYDLSRSQKISSGKILNNEIKHEDLMVKP